jgi:hypothetical protein
MIEGITLALAHDPVNRLSSKDAEIFSDIIVPPAVTL